MCVDWCGQFQACCHSWTFLFYINFEIYLKWHFYPEKKITRRRPFSSRRTAHFQASSGAVPSGQVLICHWGPWMVRGGELRDPYMTCDWSVASWVVLPWGPPLWTEWQTHTTEDIAFLQLRWWAVVIQTSIYLSGHLVFIVLQHHELDSRNLQSLALQLSCRASYLYNEVKVMRNNLKINSNISDVTNSRLPSNILTCVWQTVSSAVTLIRWLDRYVRYYRRTNRTV